MLMLYVIRKNFAAPIEPIFSPSIYSDEESFCISKLAVPAQDRIAALRSYIDWLEYEKSVLIGSCLMASEMKMHA
jgi:hypothetical protein